MKKTFYIILALLLVSGLAATGQIQRGKKPSAPKSEQTSKKPKQTSSSSNSKSKKTTKTTTQQLSSRSNTSTPSNVTTVAPPSIPAVVQQAINDMVYVSGGTFLMGATREQGIDAFRNEKPVHQVTLNSYYISKYEVTQELWQALMGNNPSYFTGNPHCPVENVSWNDCQEFIIKLNRMTGMHFRLPTEAEWEFAARGGNKSCGFKYSGSNMPDNVAWHEGNSGKVTHYVGLKTPNELGLYDMTGNVLEWCHDWSADYSSASQTNPSGPAAGTYHVTRGGCWSATPQYCRVSFRLSSGKPSYTYNNLGFRLAASSL